MHHFEGQLVFTRSGQDVDPAHAVNEGKEAESGLAERLLFVFANDAFSVVIQLLEPELATSADLLFQNSALFGFIGTDPVVKRDDQAQLVAAHFTDAKQSGYAGVGDLDHTRIDRCESVQSEA